MKFLSFGLYKQSKLPENIGEDCGQKNDASQNMSCQGDVSQVTVIFTEFFGLQSFKCIGWTFWTVHFCGLLYCYTVNTPVIFRCYTATFILPFSVHC